MVPDIRGRVLSNISQSVKYRNNILQAHTAGHRNTHHAVSIWPVHKDNLFLNSCCSRMITTHSWSDPSDESDESLVSGGCGGEQV